MDGLLDDLPPSSTKYSDLFFPLSSLQVLAPLLCLSDLFLFFLLLSPPFSWRLRDVFLLYLLLISPLQWRLPEELCDAISFNIGLSFKTSKSYPPCCRNQTIELEKIYLEVLICIESSLYIFLSNIYCSRICSLPVLDSKNRKCLISLLSRSVHEEYNRKIKNIIENHCQQLPGDTRLSS